VKYLNCYVDRRLLALCKLDFFLLWGLTHGIFLLINHSWIDFRKAKFSSIEFNRNYIFKCRLITFLSVMFVWVSFRAKSLDSTFQIWSSMLDPLKWIPGAFKLTFFDQGHAYSIFLLICLLFLEQFSANTSEIFAERNKLIEGGLSNRIIWSRNLKWACLAGVMFAFSISALIKGSPIFLYWNF